MNCKQSPEYETNIIAKDAEIASLKARVEELELQAHPQQ